MERIRGFIALELPPAVRETLGSLEQRLKMGQHSFVKWVDPNSIHITLKFLGSVPASAVPDIAKVIDGLPKLAAPLSFQVQELGVFPNWKRPQVVWVGIGGDTSRLAGIQRELENSLAPLGFPPEARAFRPHLTLGRVRERARAAERQALGSWLASVSVEPGPPFQVNGLSLMKSQLTPTGPLYTRLAFAGFQST